MPSKGGCSKEVEKYIYHLWDMFVKTNNGISVADSTVKLNDAFRDHFTNYNINHMNSKPTHNKPIYKREDCFLVDGKIYIIRWSMDSQESKKMFSSIGQKAFEVVICEVDSQTWLQKRSVNLIRFIVNNIPDDGIYILEKLIYGNI